MPLNFMFVVGMMMPPCSAMAGFEIGDENVILQGCKIFDIADMRHW